MAPILKCGDPYFVSCHLEKYLIHCHYRLSNLAQIFVVKLEAWPQMITNI